MVGAGQAFRFTVAAYLDRSGSAVIDGAAGGVTEDFVGFLDGNQLLLGVGPVGGGFQGFGLVQFLQPQELLRDLLLPGIFFEIEGTVKLLVGLV